MAIIIQVTPGTVIRDNMITTTRLNSLGSPTIAFQPFTLEYSDFSTNLIGPNVQDISNAGGTITWTLISNREDQFASVLLDGNKTLAISGATAGMRGTLRVRQGSGAPYTITAPGSSLVANSGGGAFSLSTGVGDTDRLQFSYNGTYYFWSVSNDFT